MENKLSKTDLWGILDDINYQLGKIEKEINEDIIRDRKDDTIDMCEHIINEMNKLKLELK